MAQHDYIIDDNVPGLVRQDVNAAFLAAATNNSGPTPPSTTYPGMFWADTSPAQLLKIRSIDNTSWITIGALNQPNLGRAISNLGLTATGPVWYNNTAGTFSTVQGGDIQRLSPVVTTSPSIFNSYTNFTDGVTTIITNTQGAAVLSATITPTVSTSVIVIEAQLVLGLPSTTTSAFNSTLALFAGSQLIGYQFQLFERVTTIRFRARHTSHGTTSAITYTLRFGANNLHSGSNEFFLNRAAANPTLGNTAESWIQLTEVA